MNNVPFFSTQQDLEAVLKYFCAKVPVRAAVSDHQESDMVSYINPLWSHPTIGAALGESYGSCLRFLIVEDCVEIEPRRINRNDGTLVYSIDPILNTQSVVLSVGGVLRDGVLIMGEMGSALRTETAKKFLVSFKKALTNNGHSIINGSYVGPEALKLLAAGWRLTAHAGRPPEYDLRRV